ncbi:hypothetical protein D5F01_LYC02297 [Larimichthys crocea]|uniref:Uncharacterized protein n=1 Tax=Larimichthys crocea TaxID=215358 RepID=A0A6G0J807_LARCR|nr:hypothetical protein D5F01_LYC02297 [Larimichthys crocea]
MFGRRPRLPIDLAFGLPTNNNKVSHSQYVKDLKCRLEQSYRIATSNAQKNADRNKTRFDRQVVDSSLEVGDRILVRNVKLRGKHKLADKWEDDVYIVLRKAGDMPVYTVKPEGKDGPVRTLHRDLLLPCGFLSAAVTNEPVKQPSFSLILRHPSPLPRTEMSYPCRTYLNVSKHRTSQPTEQVNSPERIPETDHTESDLPDNVCPVEKKNLPEDNVIQPCRVHDEQLPALPDVSRSEEEIDMAGNGESEEKRKDELDQMETENEEETERGTGMDTSVRRSDRTRHPPKRLDYAELGNPFVTVVKSFFHGLTTALADALSEEENPPYPLDLPTQINYI